MHPRLRFWIIVSLALIAGVMIAFQIADESMLLGELVAAALLWIVLDQYSNARPEAWILGATMFGYIVANRGFAQISLLQRLPLLPAETALAVGLGATLVRSAVRHQLPVMRDALNFAIFAWFALGTARLWSDVRANGAMALRDYATVYYALFFYVGQSLATHPPSARLMRQWVIAACAALPITYFLFTRYEIFLLQHVTFRGAPLIFYKDDLAAAYLLFGALLLLTIRRRGRQIPPNTNPSSRIPALVPVWAAAAYALTFTINSSRAALVAFITACGWWALARRWAPWKLQAVVVPTGLIVLSLVAVLGQKDFKQSRLYALYEHTASIVDVTGTRRYENPEETYVGDNNQFRLAWWHSVFDQTMEGGPLLGLGWGADITEPFVQSYKIDLGDEFNTRSPHCVLFSVFGRMGFVGLIAFLGVITAMVMRTIQLVRLVRTNDDALPTLGWWSVAWVMFVSGCFGVVLEGPMGAVIFWTALGLANAQTAAMAKESGARIQESGDEPTGSLARDFAK